MRSALTKALSSAGHAFAAAISACGAAARWEQAADFFHQMLGMNIRPDVVSCTAFASALAAGGQWQRCEEVLQWMQKVRILQ